MRTPVLPAERSVVAAMARSWTTRARSPVFAAVNGKGAELLTQALFITLLPRALGPADYGTLAAALAAVTIGSSLLTLGGQSVMARFVPAAPPGDRNALARALSARMLRWTLIQLAVGTAVLVGLAAVVPDRLSPLFVALVGLALALDVLATRAFQTALGLGRTMSWAFRYALQNAVVIAAALALTGPAGDVGAAAAVAIGSGAGLVLGLAVTADLWRDARGARDVHIPPDVRRFGILQGLGGALGHAIVRGAVLSVVVLGGSTTEAGFAALALGVGMALSSIVIQASIARLPGLVEVWTQDRGRAEAEAIRLCERTLLVLVPVTVLASLTADRVLTAVVGAGFRGAEAALVPAVALVALVPLVALGAHVAALELRPGIRAAAAAAGLATFAVVAVLAVPSWEAAGATAAVLAGTATSVVVTAFAFRRLLSARLLVPAFAGAALALAGGAWT